MSLPISTSSEVSIRPEQLVAKDALTMRAMSLGFRTSSFGAGLPG